MLTEMEAMPELAEIKSEIGGVDFGAHGTSVSVGSNSTTPQPHQTNFQWVSTRDIKGIQVNSN